MNKIIESAFSVSSLSKSYSDGQKSLEVLRDVSFEINCGQTVSLLGPSGSGKSTLLNILSGLDEATSGEVEILGTKLNRLSPNQKAKFRNENIGFVFQFYHLLPEFSALENVMMPLLVGRSDKKSLEMIYDKARTILEKVGLAERLEHYPSELSGGEQQRVAIARALVNDPKILFCDEPTGNLDEKKGLEIVQMIQDFSQKDQKTVFIVTHDEKIAKISSQVLRIEELNRRKDQ